MSKQDAARNAETTPAPASALTSARPTSAPEHDLGLLFVAPQRSSLPLDLAVPIRKRASSADGAPLRAAFLLSHVDDHLTISEIATSAQLPLEDTIASFVLLSDLGLVELTGVEDMPSGEVLRTGLLPKPSGR